MTDLGRRAHHSSLSGKLVYLVSAFTVLFAVNFLAYAYLHEELSRTAAAVDASGRQRMLSQKMAYTAMLPATGRPESAAALRKLSAEFDATISAFRKGGYLRDFYVHPAPAWVVPLVDKQEDLWRTYRQALLDLAAAGDGSAPPEAAINRIEASSEALLSASDELTAAFRMEAVKATARMDFLMVSLIAAMLLLGSVSVWFTVTRITRPLLKMSRAASDLAAGKLERVTAADASGEIAVLADAFSDMSAKLTRDLKEREALNQLLRVSAEPDQLPQLLGKQLDALLAIPWLGIESKGAVFLTARDGSNLRMVAHRGLPPKALETCSNLPPGCCMCGRAAASGEAVFSSDLDERHEVRYGGIAPHGHYCLPIKVRETTAGVLTLYVPVGHKYDEDEQTFIESVCAVMASTIEYKNLEAQTCHAQKMESLGRATGAVAHEFKNILTVLMGYNGLIASAASPDTDTADYARQAANCIERGVALVKHLLTFSRSQPQETAPTDLNSVVSSAERMLAMVLGGQVSLKLSLAPNLPLVEANKAQLEQVLVNVAMNARDAMQPRGGEFTIRTSFVPGTVHLSATDTGCGMTPKVMEQAFEPFFTTKAEGSGTGLGLSTVYSIVKAHKGDVSVNSAPGHGTTFTIALPVAADA